MSTSIIDEVLAVFFFKYKSMGVLFLCKNEYSHFGHKAVYLSVSFIVL